MTQDQQDVARLLYKHRMLTPPSDEELQRSIDLTTGFAMPVVKMSEFGVVRPAYKHLTGAGVRDRLRRAVSKANAFPDEGPQVVADRIEALKAASGAESRMSKDLDKAGRMHELGITDLQEWIKQTTAIGDMLEWARKMARPWDVEGGAVLREVTKK